MKQETDKQVLARLDLIDLALLGLDTDGGHHKQWALEQILINLVGGLEYARYLKEHQWEPGIAP